MPQAVQGVFPDRKSAERAVEDLQADGFDTAAMELSSLERPPRRPRWQTATRRSIIGAIIGSLVVGSIGAIIAWIVAQAFIGRSTFAVIAIALVAGMIGWAAGGMLVSGVPYEEGYYDKERYELGQTLLAVGAPGHEQAASQVLVRNGARDVRVGTVRRLGGVRVIPQPNSLGTDGRPPATA